MKRLGFFIIAVFLLLNFLSLKSLDAAMVDYCVVPPYVIQDVPPNVMIVLDNSGSMFNLAYACPKTNTTSAGTSTTVIPVDDVTGFQVRMQIALVHGGTNTRLQISSINATNKTITVTHSLDFSSGDIVQDYGCSGTIFYETATTCPSTQASSAGTSVTSIPVDSSNNFWVGEIIAVASSGGPYERVVTAIPNSTHITVASAVTFANNDYIYDYNCYYLKHPYPEQTFNSTKDYYGYFNSDYWYTYSSSGGGSFSRSRLKSAGAKASTEWDGNFMNWLTMRRVDIIKKVMTGGKTTTSSRLVTEKPDADDRGIYKAVFNAQNYMGCTGCTGNINVTFNTGTSNPSSFTAYSGPGNPTGWTNRGSFNVHVVTPDVVEGVLQDAVGTRARLGLTFYNTNDGGFVQVNIAAANLASAVNQINNKRPDANTPLGETLYTVAGYFARDPCSASSTGPMYHNADYPCNNNGDPYNYGTGGQNRWPSCSKSYVLYITDGEPCQDGNLPSNLVDYAGTSPHISTFNCLGTSCPARVATSPETYNFAATPMLGDPACSGNAVAGMEDVALWAHTTDLRNSTTYGYNNMAGVQNLTLFNVFAFGKGSTLLKYAAINGGFEDLNGDNLPDLQSEWDQNGDGEPDNFYEAYEGYEIEQAIRNALSTILRRASSGTAASVLASGEGSGANLIQAVFYPRRRFGNDIIGWSGENQNFWYYVDPFFINSNIREDTVSDKMLNLTNDYIVQLYFDQTAQMTKARRFQDTDGDGDADATRPTVIFENVASLWKAGEVLWSRNITTDPRAIYTTINGSTLLSGNFSTANKTVLRPYLNAIDDIEADYIIRYVHGEGLTTLLDADGIVIIDGIDRKGACSLTTSTSCTVNTDCPSGETCVPDGIDDYRSRNATIGSNTNVWKLGDVLNSTPRIASWIQLNNYDSKYSDTTYKSFIDSSGYKSRGMVFAGANDGMLHAFDLGKLELPGRAGNTCTFGTYDKACLSGTDIGKEMWAFIPKNVLPYLKYIMDPDYCHIYSVDLSPYIFDASIGTTGCTEANYWDCLKTGVTDPADRWRTVLIGGMRSGGACRDTSSTCTDCVKTPVSGLGYSSYFALDVTDQNNPQLLWEFSNENLGFATTSPAIVRIGDGSKNGKWFVVFGSGPTGPIETTDHQFLGRSDQNLKLFILDLKTGSLLRTIDTTIQYAFAGSMLNSTLDYNLNYQDDVVYIGYVKRTGSSPNFTWTDGGVGRLLTKESSTPANWVWSKVIDGIGPVTSSIAKLQNNKTHNLWLYFGTGRYYYELGTAVDDADNQRKLFGIKEPCFTSSNTLDTTCTALVSSGDLTNVTSVSDVPSESTANSTTFKGWYVNLDAPGNYTYYEGDTLVTRGYRAERVITDPMATTTGLVFFTTYKPYSDECGLGGKSFIWAVRYTTGGAAGALLKGKALLQVSTGSIEQLNLSTAFTEAGGRKTSAMEGVPPTAQGLSLLSTPPPVKRVLHMRER